MAYGTVNADIIGTSVSGSNLGAGNATRFKNKIINGDFRIDQRYAGSATTPAAGGPAYLVDRWAFYNSQASKLTYQQNAGSVTPPTGFTNYLGITTASAYSIGSSDVFLINQPIEGLNVADLDWGTANAKTITLSFWARSSLTGTFGGSLRNSALNRSYPFSYTISSANTWTQISITIVGDTTGSWLTTNGTGIQVAFGLGVGATYSGTAGTWAGTNYASATGAVSVVGTNGATFYITGVQLEVGSSATGFEYVDYTTQLAMCQRYYTKDTNYPVQKYTIFNSGNVRSTPWYFPVTMRAAPTVTFTDTANAAGKITIANDGGSSQTNISPPSSVSISQNNWRFEAGGMTGTTGNSGFIQINYFATAEL